VYKRQESRGVKRTKLLAKAAGGASMFKRLSSNSLMDISSRNIESLRSELKRIGIRLVADDLGGERGRTITFDVATSRLTIKIVDPSRMDSNKYVTRTI
jgi:chemotaxis protein CheD